MNIKKLKEQLDQMATVEVVVPDLSGLSEFYSTVLDKFVSFVETLPEEEKKTVLSNLILIANNDENSVELMREISGILFRYGKEVNIVDIANLFKFVADVMDFSDEILYMTIEALLGIEEVEEFLKKKKELLKDKAKLKEEILHYWHPVLPVGHFAGWSKLELKKERDYKRVKE